MRARRRVHCLKLRGLGDKSGEGQKLAQGCEGGKGGRKENLAYQPGRLGIAMDGSASRNR